MSWKPGETIFNLDALRDEFAETEMQESMYDEDIREKWVYLGTVFSMMPSGKFYTPWACSNVEPCERCSGRGSIDSPTRGTLPESAAAVLATQAKQMDWQIRSLAMRFYGPACNGAWPPQLTVLLSRTAEVVQRLSAKVQCPHCEGVGSREAYLDEVWREQAEEELGKIGAFLQSGEGDPCDLFAVTVVESDESC